MGDLEPFSNRTIDDWDNFDSDGYYNATEYLIDDDNRIGSASCHSKNYILFIVDGTVYEIYSGKLTINSFQGTLSGSVEDATFIDIESYPLDISHRTRKISFCFRGNITNSDE